MYKISLFMEKAPEKGQSLKVKEVHHVGEDKVNVILVPSADKKKTKDETKKEEK